jgi:hypothetical protein
VWFCWSEAADDVGQLEVLLQRLLISYFAFSFCLLYQKAVSSSTSKMVIQALRM